MKNRKKHLALIFASLSLAGALATVPLFSSSSVSAEQTSSSSSVKGDDWDDNFDSDVDWDDNWDKDFDYDDDDFVKKVLNQYTSLSDTEKETLKTTYQKAEVLFEELDDLYKDNGTLKDETRANEINKELTSLFDGVKDILAKIEKEDLENAKTQIKSYLDQSTGLTDKEKETYQSTAEELYSLENELEGLYDFLGNASDESKATELTKKIKKAEASLQELDNKILKAEIEASTKLTDKEKETLISSYEEIDTLIGQLEALYDDAGNVSDESKLNELTKKIDKAYDKIDDLEDKLYEDDNDDDWDDD